jgi:hypothetical protein
MKNRIHVTLFLLLLATLATAGCADDNPASLDEAQSQDPSYMAGYRHRQNLTIRVGDDELSIPLFDAIGDVSDEIESLLDQECGAVLGVEQGCGTPAVSEFGYCTQYLCATARVLCQANLAMELGSMVAASRALANGSEVLPSDSPTRAGLFEVASRVAGSALAGSSAGTLLSVLQSTNATQALNGNTCETEVPETGISAGEYGLTLWEELFYLSEEAADRATTEYVAAADASFAESDGALDRSLSASALRRHAASLLYGALNYA